MSVDSVVTEVIWSRINTYFFLNRTVKCVRWRSKVFELSSDGNSVKPESMSSRIWKKISESIRDTWVDDTIVILADDRKASPVKNQENIDRFLWSAASDRSRIFFPPIAVTWTVLPKQLFCISFKKQFFRKGPKMIFRHLSVHHKFRLVTRHRLSVNSWPKHSISVSPHLPYSPDPAPCDFLLFPRLKVTLKGKKF